MKNDQMTEVVNKDLMDKISFINIRRAFVFSFIIFVISTIIEVPFAFPIHIKDFSKYKWYIAADSLLILLSLILLIVTSIYKYVYKTPKKGSNILVIIIAIGLVLNTVLMTVLDQKVTSGSITNYIVGIILLSTSLYLQPKQCIILIIPTYIIFIIGMLISQKNYNLLVMNLTSGTIITFSGIANSIILYNLFKSNFVNQAIITELNKNLEKKVNNQLSFILKGEKIKKYLPSQLVDSILNEKKEYIDSPKRKKLTIFFSDIKNFTLTTDSLEPEELTELLNQYFTEMTKIALKWGGTIDKYIGDGIMIFFGAPEEILVSEQVNRCLKMAIEMQMKMIQLQKVWFERGIEFPIEIRTGINTGIVNVGNFGSEDRLSYTIIGGQVNLASRLETSCEPNKILMSHSSFVFIKDNLKSTIEKTITVKGINRSIKAYEINPKENIFLIE